MARRKPILDAAGERAPYEFLGSKAGMRHGFLGGGDLVPIDELHPYHRNPRRGDVRKIAESLAVNGQYRSIVVNRGTHTGRPWEILAGNHTTQAALLVCWTHIGVEWVDVDEATAARIVLVDNATNDAAGYDTELLEEILRERVEAGDTVGAAAPGRQLDRLMADNAARNGQAVELWRAGVPVPEIASRLSFPDEDAVWAVLDAAVLQAREPSVADQRRLEMDRLDRLQAALWPKAVRADKDSIDRVLRVMDMRYRLRGRSEANGNEVRAAFDRSVSSSAEIIGGLDDGLVEVGRRIADRIDEAMAVGEGQEVTKALYLSPHMMNVLRELLATPASRKAVKDAGKPEGGAVGKLAELRSIEEGRKGRRRSS